MNHSYRRRTHFELLLFSTISNLRPHAPDFWSRALASWRSVPPRQQRHDFQRRRLCVCGAIDVMLRWGWSGCVGAIKPVMWRARSAFSARRTLWSVWLRRGLLPSAQKKHEPKQQVCSETPTQCVSYIWKIIASSPFAGCVFRVTAPRGEADGKCLRKTADCAVESHLVYLSSRYLSPLPKLDGARRYKKAPSSMCSRGFV